MKYLYQNPLYKPERTTHIHPNGFVNYYDELITNKINPDQILVDGNCDFFQPRDRPVGGVLMSDIYEINHSRVEDLEDTKSKLNFKLQPKDTLVFYSLSHLLKNLYSDEPINKISYFRKLQIDVHFFDEGYTLRFSEPGDYLNGQLAMLLKMNNFCNAMVRDNDDRWHETKNRWIQTKQLVLGARTQD